MSQKTDLEERLNKLCLAADGWVVAWGLSRLLRDISIDFSDELGSALGTLDLPRMRICLNGVLLLQANEQLLHETLCHELAHAVAAFRYGTGIDEHGVEWGEYLEKAGFKPRPVIELSQVAGLRPPSE